MSKNVSNFISKLDKLGEESIDVYLPSKKKAIKVKPLNLKQQKDLISSVLDGLKGSLDFNKTLNSVILSNSGESDLKVYDKVPFIISLRREALGNTVYVDKKPIDLDEIIKNIKKNPLKIKDTKSITFKNLKINLQVPTLREENVLLSKCENDIDNDDATLKEGVGLLYIVELIKYINSLEIDDQVLDMSEIRINERVKLVEKLPLNVYSELSKFIEAINIYNNSLLTVGEIELDIDSEFFDTSDPE
tara:strand:- start:4170 stop:4910 length:741 start_codon:yes stop_codon:yes gene_type:complete